MARSVTMNAEWPFEKHLKNMARRDAERRLADALRELRAAALASGHDVTVLVSGDGRSFEIFVEPAKPVRRAPTVLWEAGS